MFLTNSHPCVYILLQYAVGCRACLFVCSDLLAVSEFVFSLLLFCEFRENGNRCAVTQIE